MLLGDWEEGREFAKRRMQYYQARNSFEFIEDSSFLEIRMALSDDKQSATLGNREATGRALI
jgi:hypothetical protein